MRSIRQSRLSWGLILLLSLGMVVFLGGCDSDDDDGDIPEHEHEAVVPDHSHEMEVEMPAAPRLAPWGRARPS